MTKLQAQRADVQQYLREISQFAPITPKEEQELARRILQGGQEQAAQQRLIEAHLPLAFSWAKKYAGRGVDLMDLVQEANLGLALAARRFDPSKGRFATYARWWMKERLVGAFAGNDEWEVISFDQQPELLETLADDDATPEEMAQLKQLCSFLHATFACLTERERLVLVYHYGLDGKVGIRTFEQVANHLKISSTRARQIEADALRKIRRSGSAAALYDYWREHSAS